MLKKVVLVFAQGPISASFSSADESRDWVRGFVPTKSMPPVNLYFTGNGFNVYNAGHQS